MGEHWPLQQLNVKPISTKGHPSNRGQSRGTIVSAPTAPQMCQGSRPGSKASPSVARLGVSLGRCNRHPQAKKQWPWLQRRTNHCSRGTSILFLGRHYNRTLRDEVAESWSLYSWATVRSMESDINQRMMRRSNGLGVSPHFEAGKATIHQGSAPRSKLPESRFRCRIQ